jgi:hypothetical protein
LPSDLHDEVRNRENNYMSGTIIKVNTIIKLFEYIVALVGVELGVSA